jgi:serine-type D-Ala-D-Ala carboxypeptidase/endopeptidase
MCKFSRSWRTMCGLALGCCSWFALIDSTFAQMPTRDRLNSLVQPYIDSETIVGMSVGIIHQGERQTQGYGVKRRSGTESAKDNARVPDSQTVYEIGSVSKTFSGLLLADAVLSGRVRLDQPIQELLPNSVKLDSQAKQPITLQHLSTHVSGLPRLPSNLRMDNPANPYVSYTADDMFRFLNEFKPAHQPGERMLYSNYAVGLLGTLLARQAGSSYSELLKNRICVPLKMKDTVIELSNDLRSRLASPYTADGAPASNWDLNTFVGAGGIRSTVDDMLNYIQAHLDPPENDLGKAIELGWKIHQKPIHSEDFAMGLGWHVARDGNTRWHNGQTGGYHSMVLIDRRSKSGVVVLSNTATGEVDKLAEDLIRMLAGGKVTPRTFEKEKAVKVSREVMQKYVGRYELAPTFIFTVKLDEDRLMVDLTGQPALRIFPKSDTQWEYRVVDARIQFNVDGNGNCTELVLDQNGIKQTAKRMP